MKKGMIKCGLLVMVLSMSSLYSVYPVSAQSETDSHVLTGTHAQAQLNFKLKSGTTMAIVGSPGLDTVLDYSIYYDIKVKSGEKIIVSYEGYNEETAKWEPNDVRIFHESFNERVYIVDHSYRSRFVVTGDRMQEPTNQYITVSYVY